jgi:lycopene cyclase domain-containing protein
MKFTYLLVNFLSVLVPFAFSFHPKIKFNKQFFSFFVANIIASLVFVTWDAIFTSKGIWSFNKNYILGFFVFNLPLEEILFFICVPFACLFSYHCSFIFFTAKWNPKVENIFVLLFSSSLLVIGMVFYDKAYTCAAFTSTALLLLLIKFHFKVGWLSQFLSLYPLLLIPFFIVNGILTGTGLEHPVVVYNDLENLGIRIYTIPVEDLVYAFELLLLNVFLFYNFRTVVRQKVQLVFSEKLSQYHSLLRGLKANKNKERQP